MAQKSYLLLLKIADRLSPLDTGIPNTARLYHQKIDKPTPGWWLFAFIYLTPCIPLSFKGEGEENRRGASAPLKRPYEL